MRKTDFLSLAPLLALPAVAALGCSARDGGRTHGVVAYDDISSRPVCDATRDLEIAVTGGNVAVCVRGEWLPLGDARGKVVQASSEPPGPNCSGGGLKLVFGVDANANGTIDASEVTDVRYVCTPAPPTTMTLAVTVRFERPTTTEKRRIDSRWYGVPAWGSMAALPVPYVNVALQDETGAIVADDVFADAQGVARFPNLSTAHSYVPIVRSIAKSPARGLDIAVVNNTGAATVSGAKFRDRYKPYTTAFPSYAPTALASQNLVLTLPSGWDANRWELVDSMRVAGPYSLLAAAANEAIMVEEATPGGPQWRPLTILWSVKNKGGGDSSGAPKNYDLGVVDGSGAFYGGKHGAMAPDGTESSSGSISEDFVFVSGDQTFEAFDLFPSTMAHEMGHFVSRLFSRAFTPGASHAFTDVEDPALAFDEGLATGIALLSLQSSFELRFASVATNAGGRAIIAHSLDFGGEQVTDDGTPMGTPYGWYQETTVASLLWNAHASAGLTGAEVLAPLFTPEWKAGEWLPTIWPLVARLRATHPTKAAAIDALAAARRITGSADDWAVGETFVPPNMASDLALPVYTTMRVGQSATLCSTGSANDYNALGNVRYLRFLGDGTVRTVTFASTLPGGGAGTTVPIAQRQIFVPGAATGSGTFFAAASGTTLSIGACVVAKAPYANDVTACQQTAPVPSDRQCWTITF